MVSYNQEREALKSEGRERKPNRFDKREKKPAEVDRREGWCRALYRSMDKFPGVLDMQTDALEAVGDATCLDVVKVLRDMGMPKLIVAIMQQKEALTHVGIQVREGLASRQAMIGWGLTGGVCFYYYPFPPSRCVMTGMGMLCDR